LAPTDFFRRASGGPKPGDTPEWPGLEDLPESVRAGLLASVPVAPEDDDAEADPWDIGAEDVAASEAREAALPRPAPPSVRPQREPPAVPSTGAARHSGLDARVPAPARTPTPPAFRSGVDLARLVSCQTPIAWFEAVAIAQELCAVLMDGRPATRVINLEPGAVSLTPDGGIELRRDVPAGLPPVGQAARILLALLGEAQAPPVQLRLLALQEVSPAPSCATLSEFSTRLALFERPNRRTAIRAVYERFQSLPRQDAAAIAPASAPAVPAAAAQDSGRRGRTALIPAAAVLMVMALGTAAAWLWPSASPQLGSAGSQGRSPRTGGTTVAAVWESATSAVKNAARRLGVTSNEPAIPAPPAQPIDLPAAPRTPPARSPRARWAAAPPAPLVAPAPAPATAIVAAAVVPDTTIYAAVDTDVVPPSLLRSRLPADPQAGPGSDSVPEIELVVSQAGEVELVKLLTPQAGVRSSMMLSAVKAWRFAPATRDGRPVRYRLVVRLTSQ